MKEIVKFIKEGLKITTKTKVNERPKYNYHPKTKNELKDLLKQLIKERGNEADLNDIDTSEITDMADLSESFSDVEKFNGDISQWDVSNVTDMSSMFSSCKSFNQDISNWDVSKVKDMYSMFDSCESFNQDISNWNVSKVTDMRYMFSRCKSFNQNVSKWNVSKVKKYDNIFFNCPIEEKYKPKKFKYYEKYI